MLRDYDSATDKPIVKASIDRDGRDWSLTAIAADLKAAGVQFPPNYNDSKQPSALALDRDICEFIKGLNRCRG